MEWVKTKQGQIILGEKLILCQNVAKTSHLVLRVYAATFALKSCVSSQKIYSQALVMGKLNCSKNKAMDLAGNPCGRRSQKICSSGGRCFGGMKKDRIFEHARVFCLGGMLMEL